MASDLPRQCPGSGATDHLKQLALKLLEVEKNRLIEEKQEYSCAVVVVVTPERRYYEEATFENETEMDAVYGAIVERAKANEATAIITINLARGKDVKGERELDSYRWGQLAEENQPRCLSLTISGPGMTALSVTLSFGFNGGQVILGEQSDFEPAILNILPNWP